MSLRYRVCPDCHAMHAVDDWPDNHRFWNEVLCAPMVISDNLPDLLHPSDNRHYDSKRAFRATTRAFGMEEVGTDANRDRRWVDTITDNEVATAKQMVDQGYVPRPETATSDDIGSIVT